MDDPPDCDPDWDQDADVDIPLAHPDLHGQGLTTYEMHTITDIPITGNWL